MKRVGTGENDLRPGTGFVPTQQVPDFAKILQDGVIVAENPGKLNFTGDVTVTYDGDGQVGINVEFPTKAIQDDVDVMRTDLETLETQTFDSISNLEATINTGTTRIQNYLDEAITARDASETARTNAEFAYNQAMGVKSTVESIQDQTLAYQIASETAKNLSELARDEADAKAGTASIQASSALAYSNEAGDFAAAAEGSVLLAQTSETNAEIARVDAVTSMNTAAASASSAASSETLATTAQTNAENAANAAATSETTAASYATDASQSASASQAEKLAAETAKSNAENAEYNAVIAYDDASEASSSAQSASILAANAKTEAGNFANSSATSASEASSFASDTLQRATAAESAQIGAETAQSAAYVSETKAANSETNAAGSASSASMSEGIATDAATEAGESADAAFSSATTASSEATDAEQAASVANTAKLDAETAKSGAETSENNAASSETNAAGSASNAATSATNAANSESASGQSADAAASSASSASSSATDAAQEASAANSSKLAAETARGAAETAQSEAATSETNASGYANSAATYAAVTASSRSGNLVTDPNIVRTEDLMYWKNSLGSGIEIVTHGRSDARCPRAIRSSDSSDGDGGFYSKPYIPGNWNGKWIRFRFKARGSEPMMMRCGLGYRYQDNTAFNTWRTVDAGNLPGDGSFAEFEKEMQVSSSVEMDHIALRWFHTGGSAGAWSEVTDMEVYDVTAEKESGDSADAAATSASEASTQADEASVSADAAQSSSLSASASRDDAAGSASAAFESAQDASAFVDDAEQFSSASDQSRIDAETAKGSAESARNEAVSARDDAQGSEANAKASEGIAVRVSRDASSYAIGNMISDGGFTEVYDGDQSKLHPNWGGDSDVEVSRVNHTGDEPGYTHSLNLSPKTSGGTGRARWKIPDGPKSMSGKKLRFSGFVDRPNASGTVEVGLRFVNPDGSYHSMSEIPIDAAGSWPEFDVVYTVPDNILLAHSIIYRLDYSSNSDVVRFTGLKVEDVTESEAAKDAEIQAGIYRDDAVNAKDDAEGASASAESSKNTAVAVSSQGVGLFRDQFMPDNWVTWVGGPSSKVTNSLYPTGQTFIFDRTNTDNCGIITHPSSTNWSVDGGRSDKSFRVEIEFTLLSGSLDGSGFFFDWETSDGDFRAQESLEEMLNGPVVLGQPMLASTVVDRPSNITGTPSGSGFQFYLMVNYDPFGTKSTKELHVHRIQIYPITTTEAAVTETANAVADLKGNAEASYTLRVKAGGASSGFEIVAADDPINGAATSIRADADEFLIDGSVKAQHLAADSVTASNITVGAVSAAKIASGAITSSKIDSESVTAEKIASDAITAEKIASESVTAEKIASNSVTAKNITISDFGNLIPQGDTDNGDPSVWVTKSGDLPFEVHSQGSQGYSGSAESPLNFYWHAPDDNADYGIRTYLDLAVEPGEELRVEFKYAGGGGSRRREVGLWVFFEDVNGGFVTIRKVTTEASGTSWNKHKANITVPAGAAKVYSFALVSPGGGSGAAFVTDLRAYRRNAGDLVVDGGIKAESLDVGSLDAISADLGIIEVGTANIADAAITSAKIGDLEVDNAKIANLTVGTEKITGNAVTRLGVDTNSSQTFTTASYEIALDVTVPTEGGNDLMIETTGELTKNSTPAGTGDAQFRIYRDGSTIFTSIDDTRVFNRTLVSTSLSGSTHIQVRVRNSAATSSVELSGASVVVTEFKK